MVFFVVLLLTGNRFPMLLKRIGQRDETGLFKRASRTFFLRPRYIPCNSISPRVILVRSKFRLFLRIDECFQKGKSETTPGKLKRKSRENGNDRSSLLIYVAKMSTSREPCHGKVTHVFFFCFGCDPL